MLTGKTAAHSCWMIHCHSWLSQVPSGLGFTNSRKQKAGWIYAPCSLLSWEKHEEFMATQGANNYYWTVLSIAYSYYNCSYLEQVDSSSFQESLSHLSCSASFQLHLPLPNPYVKISTRNSKAKGYNWKEQLLLATVCVYIHIHIFRYKSIKQYTLSYSSNLFCNFSQSSLNSC